MFLSRLFKHTRARVMTALAGLTMVLGVGAAIAATAQTQNEVVETRAWNEYSSGTRVFVHIGDTIYNADTNGVYRIKYGTSQPNDSDPIHDMTRIGTTQWWYFDLGSSASFFQIHRYTEGEWRNKTSNNIGLGFTADRPVLQWNTWSTGDDGWGTGYLPSSVKIKGEYNSWADSELTWTSDANAYVGTFTTTSENTEIYVHAFWGSSETIIPYNDKLNGPYDTAFATSTGGNNIGIVYATKHRIVVGPNIWSYGDKSYIWDGSDGSRITPLFNATITAGSGGSVSAAAISDIVYESAVSISGNTLTIDGNSVTASPSTATAQYTYAFSNWSGVSDGDIIRSALSITANFTATTNKYTVSFDLNDHGSPAPSSQTIEYGAKVTQPSPAPAETGYNFGGWYKEEGCTNAWNFASDVVTANTTLYAKWTAQSYAINYFDQGGSEFSGTHASGYPTTHTYGADTALKGATKTGYDFDGWFMNSGCTGDAVTTLGATAYTGAITLYAKWTVNSYAVTIAAGTGIKSVYLSTTSTAQSGSASETSFTFGSTVYGFVVLDAGYGHLDSWTKVSATDEDVEDAKYCVGSLTVLATTNDFGTQTPKNGKTAADAFASGFISAFEAICKDNDTSDSYRTTLGNMWEAKETAYIGLAGNYVRYWLLESRCTVEGFYAQYDWICGKYGNNGKTAVQIAKIKDHDFLERDPEDKSGAMIIPGAPTGNESPLTMTLWIVLGCGVAGLGAIGAAYFVSKKKKRPEA